LNLYETTFIVNPQGEESAIDAQVKAIGKIITDNGGKIVREERMGTRRLAYPIAGLNQGFYATFLFEAEPPVLPLIDRYLKLGESYLRYLTIRYEGDPDKSYGDAFQKSFEVERGREGEDEDRRGFRSDRRGGRGHRDSGGRDNDSYNPRKRNYRN